MKLSRVVIMMMLVAIAGMIISAPRVYAYPISVGDQIKFKFAYGNENRAGDGIDGIGGVFGAYNTSGKLLFETFCLETNESISLNSYYHVGSISGLVTYNGYAELKGYIPPIDGDPLDTRTAYLFQNFAMTSLGYEHTSINANALQRAIWFIEQEYGNIIPGDKNKPPIQAVLDQYLGTDPTGILAQQFFNLANANANGSLYGVQVVNVIDGNRQSMLVAVAEPWLLILLGIGLSAVGLAARRYPI